MAGTSPAMTKKIHLQAIRKSLKILLAFSASLSGETAVLLRKISPDCAIRNHKEIQVSVPAHLCN